MSARHPSAAARPAGAAPRIRGIPAVAGRRVHTLILGSMPGVASLEASQYYAHPRNVFWDAVETLGIARTLPYATRLARLRRLGFALWDVLAHCEREGSLDSAIRAAEPNPIDDFVLRHPELRRIWLNGLTARRYFDRHFEPPASVALRTLPSTSPANTRGDKRETWSRALAAAARRRG